jgi:signal peptidase I
MKNDPSSDAPIGSVTLLDGASEGGTATSGATLSPSDRSEPAVPTSSSRRRRDSDYRLRGLDLQAEGLTPVLPARPDHLNRRHRRRVLAGWIIVLAVGIAVAVILRDGIVEPYSVRSGSMAPTLQIGDRIESVTSSLVASPIARGSIVVLRSPEVGACGARRGSSDNLVLRVIGEPGQTIWSVGNTIYIDGRRLKEPGWYDPNSGQVGSKAIPRTTIAAGSYFVMGDNRTHSCDSRSFGTIPASSIVGKVVGVVLRGGHPYVHFF